MKNGKEKMQSKGAEKLHIMETTSSDDTLLQDEPPPIEQLVQCLLENDREAFESYFEGMDVYEAEKVRTQVQQLVEKEIAKTKNTAHP